MKMLFNIIWILFLLTACGSDTAPITNDDPTAPASDSTESTPSNSADTDTPTATEADSNSSDPNRNDETVEPEADEDNSEGGNASEDAPDETDDESETSEANLDESEECQLQLRAEVRDQSGACTTCSFGDYITVVGVVENPCASDKNYQATENCIVSEFVIMNLEAGSSSEYPMTCDGGTTVSIVPAGGELTKTRPAGRLSQADYHLTVSFKDPNDTVAELYFRVD